MPTPLDPRPSKAGTFPIVRQKAVDATELQLADAIGVTELTPELKKIAADAVDARLDVSSRRKAAGLAALRVGGKSLGEAMNDLVEVQKKLKAAQLKEALRNNAEILFKTFKAFTDAGFSDRAFQLVLSQTRR